MPDKDLAGERSVIGGLVGDQPEAWDLAGELPAELLRKLGAMGVLCAEVPAAFGGLAITSRLNGELTAYVGSLCSSLRSIMTSQGMAAWTVQRFGDREQRQRYLTDLTGGQLAAVAFSEPGAGSDLSVIQTEIEISGNEVVLNGEKTWVTGARYADLLLVLGWRHGTRQKHGTRQDHDIRRDSDAAAIVVVPADTPGVRIEPIADPLGCRAGGHARLWFDDVKLPASSVLGGGGQPLSLLFTAALCSGRISVAWGCVGIIRACLTAAASHAARRQQAGKPLADHQLVARHLAGLLVAEQVSTRACEHASECWQSASQDMAIAAVLAKHVSAGYAARAAATAVQVLASAGAQDGHVVARAYRDAKLMEIIEGSNEICELILADHAVSTAARN
jgi:alkylation response protein AidB-like acyl-CoA dehydrogenase